VTEAVVSPMDSSYSILNDSKHDRTISQFQQNHIGERKRYFDTLNDSYFATLNKNLFNGLAALRIRYIPYDARQKDRR
jgi:hypothetical protein